MARKMAPGERFADTLMKKQTRNTWLFIAFLLLGGVIHSLKTEGLALYFLTTFNYCAEYLIYAGLILFWMQSVNGRLLPTRAKGYVLLSGGLLLLLIAAQFIKYRMAVIPSVTRYCWYIYYLPMLLVPTLFLMTCFFLGAGANLQRPYELLFLIPAGLLALGILTNDWHSWAFIPTIDMAALIGRPNTYTHGFLYYAAYGWIGCAMTAGLIFLVAASRRSGSWKKALLPLFTLAVTPTLLTVCNRLPKDSLPVTFEWPEVLIFSMLSVLEACIRSRLIPSNENYPGFFAQLSLPALITDRELTAVFQTQSSVPAANEQLTSCLRSPVSLTPNTRLYSMAIRAGYAFWTEDESALNRLNEELADANEMLEQENDLLDRERELAAEQAGIEARIRLYQQAAREVYPTQKKISAILEKVRPGTASFRPEIARALALTAYVKRKANFVLVEAEREAISAGELASALAESAHYLRYCGMNATVAVQAERAFPCREAMAVYACFEAACEALLGKTEDVFIRLLDRELLILADAHAFPARDSIPELSGLPLPAQTSWEDGQFSLRFPLGGDAR